VQLLPNHFGLLLLLLKLSASAKETSNLRTILFCSLAVLDPSVGDDSTAAGYNSRLITVLVQHAHDIGHTSAFISRIFLEISML